VRTGETILEEPLDADGPSNALPMGAGDADVWVECSDGDVVVRGRGFDGGWGEYELAVIREGETVGGFRFAPRQSEDVFRIVFADFRFSPECGYLAVILSGDIGPDQQARDELWILDLAAQTLELALMSRWSPFLIFDYPVQTVDPAWSPDGSRVVFGDGEFGLETYDVMRGRRRLLAGPQRDLYDPVWSPTGKWIAAVSLGREGGYVAVITPDGRHAAYSPQCDGAYAFAWSPLRDELAYICSGRSCEADSLWMWRVGETE
jgi:Tol biopolymer transport system component